MQRFLIFSLPRGVSCWHVVKSGPEKQTEGWQWLIFSEHRFLTTKSHIVSWKVNLVPVIWCRLQCAHNNHTFTSACMTPSWRGPPWRLCASSVPGFASLLPRTLITVCHPTRHSFIASYPHNIHICTGLKALWKPGLWFIDCSALAALNSTCHGPMFYW